MNAVNFFLRAALTGSAPTLCIFAVVASAQTARVDLSVDDPRPVAEALLEFARRYPTIITYEDPRYVYSSDVQDVTEKVRRSPTTSTSPRIVVPKGGALRLTYDVDEETGQPADYARTLSDVLATKNLNPTGGHFDVRQEGDVFHVVPTEIRDGQGRWVPQTSILDTPITLSTEERNGYELTEAILKAVSDANGVTVGLAVERFTPTFTRFNGRIDVKNEPARDVLLRTLHAMSKRFTYHLLYDPSGKYYVLGAHVAAEPPPKAIPLDLSDIPQPGVPGPAGRGPASPKQGP